MSDSNKLTEELNLSNIRTKLSGVVSNIKTHTPNIVSNIKTHTPNMASNIKTHTSLLRSDNTGKFILGLSTLPIFQLLFNIFSSNKSHDLKMFNYDFEKSNDKFSNFDNFQKINERIKELEIDVDRLVKQKNLGIEDLNNLENYRKELIKGKELLSNAKNIKGLDNTSDSFINVINKKIELSIKHIDDVFNSTKETIEKAITPVVNMDDHSFIDNISNIFDGLYIPATGFSIAAALLYLGRIKLQNFLLIRDHDNRIIRTISNYSKLISDDLNKYKDELDSKKNTCNSNETIESGTFKIDNSIICYIKYSASFLLFFSIINLKLLSEKNIDIRNIRNIDEIINLDKNNISRELLSSSKEDFDNLINVLIPNNDLKKTFYNDLNNGVIKFIRSKNEYDIKKIR
jgi:hypothetical protein